MYDGGKGEDEGRTDGETVLSEQPPGANAPGGDRPILLEIGALSHGPDGVARHEGRVVFVPGTVPGDRVYARVVEERPRWARAEVVRRCDAGAARREAPCAWVDACGGCAWQHVDYAAQLAAKAANVHAALARIGGITGATELPILAAPDEWRYRHRIRLHVGPGGTIGYRRHRSHEIVAIDDCVIADAAITAALPLVRDAVPRIGTRLRDVELIANGRSGVVVAMTATERLAPGDDHVIERFITPGTPIVGVHLAGRGSQRTVGDVRVFVMPDDATTIVQRPGTFSQVHPAANRVLVASVKRLVGGGRVLDLFCGAGNLSLPLARAGSDVLGVDANPAAIADARTSADAGGIASARFELAPALRFLSQQGLAGADLVVLDPPRSGAAAEVAQLTRLRPRRIVYVACDPATLARDTGTLRRNGYEIGQVQPIDLFPQTPHVETVLTAERAID